jgi:glycerate 2-kinase
MKILIAPDSFKGTFAAPEIAALIRDALPKPLHAAVTLQPLADGGEGTMPILSEAANAEIVQTRVTGPLGDFITAAFGIAESPDRNSVKTAFIESAAAAGILLVPPSPLRPDRATTFGVGELVAAALNAHCKKIIVGLGGSATMDAGAGMLQALGVALLDKHGNSIAPGNHGLERLTHLDAASWNDVLHRLAGVTLMAAADVETVLLGERGCVKTFGVQKGMNPTDAETFEKNIAHFAALLEKHIGTSLQHHAGSGAAGGLGFALLALGGKIISGATLISDRVLLESKIRAADLVITGEGMFDPTSLTGKVVGHVARLCMKHNKRCVVVCGVSTISTAPGVESVLSLFEKKPDAVADAKRETAHRLTETLAAFFNRNYTTA